jgi:hypothetical protein
MNNSIIDDVRAARASLAAEHGYDRAKILAWARAEQAEVKLRDSPKVSIPVANSSDEQATGRSRAKDRKPKLVLGKS